MPYYDDESDESYGSSSTTTSGGCSFGSDDLFAIGCSPGSYDSKKSRNRYEEAFEPVCAHSGTPYPISQRKIDEVSYLSHSNSHEPICCRDKAVADMIRYNSREPSDTEIAALDRLHAAMTKDRFRDWPSDLTIKMFPDLDTVFFGGRLWGNTTVEWSDDANHTRGAWGCTTSSDRTGQAEIMLNAKHILVKPGASTPAKMAWSTLLHEMCQ